MRDSMKLVKAGAAFLVAVLVFLVLNMFAGALYRVGPAEKGEEVAAAPVAEKVAGAAAVKEEIEEDITALMAKADPKRGEKIFKKCKNCHSLEPGMNKVGPTLHGVVDRPVGSVEGYDYSSTLKNFGGNWTPERLSEFLKKPRAYAPGTKMTFTGLKKPQDRADLIAFLAQSGQQ